MGTPGVTARVVLFTLAIHACSCQFGIFIDPSQRVVLDGKGTTAGARSNVVAVTWSVTNDVLSLSEAAVTSATDPELGIAPGTLKAGEVYNFRFTARDQDDQDEYEDITVMAHEPPSGGVVSVSTPVVEAGKTWFSIGTSGWLSNDPGDEPLEYRYVYRTALSDVEVPLTVYSPSPITEPLLLPPLSDTPLDLTIVAQARNSLGVVGHALAENVLQVVPPAGNCEVAEALQDWHTARYSRNVSAILRAAAVVPAVVAANRTSNDFGVAPFPPAASPVDVLRHVHEALDNVTLLTADIAESASYAVVQALRSIEIGIDTEVHRKALSILRLVGPAAASSETVNRQIRQSSVASRSFMSNALAAVSAVVESFAFAADRSSDLSTHLADTLDMLGAQHLVGRVCGEEFVADASSSVQLVSALRSAGSLSGQTLQLPGGAWTLPQGFASDDGVLDTPCVPVRAYVLPRELKAAWTRPPASPFDEQNPVQASYVQYIRIGDDDAHVPGTGQALDFSAGMTLDFELENPITDRYVRCAYKHNLTDPWMSDDSCRLTNLNATHGQCTCYHASAMVIQSVPTCYPNTCWKKWFPSAWIVDGCKSGGCTTSSPIMPVDSFLTCAYSGDDGCGGYLYCGVCNAGAPASNQTQSCVPVPGSQCVAFDHPDSVALQQKYCDDWCGFVLLPVGSTRCSCAPGKTCVRGRCKQCNDTCASLGKTCGVWPDSCGGYVGPCGTCSGGTTCSSSGTCVSPPPPPACSPLTTCPAGRCGAYPDGCGGYLNCSGCPGAQLCNSTNYCKSCKTCMDYVFSFVLLGQAGCSDTCTVPGERFIPVDNAGCGAFGGSDDCGNSIDCGLCLAASNNQLIVPQDCLMGQCWSPPSNQLPLVSSPETDCGYRCGVTMFPTGGSRICQCAPDLACVQGICKAITNFAVDFNATGHFAGFSMLCNATKNISITFWVNAGAINDTTKDQFLVANGVNSNGGVIIKILKSDSTRLTVTYGGTIPVTQKSTNYVLPVHTWTHIAFTTSDGLTWLLYVNGNYMESITLTMAMKLPAVRFSVGGNGASGTQNFDGMLDDVQIWHRTLSAAEVYNNYALPPNTVDPDLKLYLPFSEGSGTTTNIACIVVGNVTVSIVPSTGATINWATRGYINASTVGAPLLILGDNAPRMLLSEANAGAQTSTSTVESASKLPDMTYGMAGAIVCGIAIASVVMGAVIRRTYDATATNAVSTDYSVKPLLRHPATASARISPRSKTQHLNRGGSNEGLDAHPPASPDSSSRRPTGLRNVAQLSAEPSLAEQIHREPSAQR